MYTIGCTSSAQNHPKISCSEDRFLSFRSGIFPQDNTDGTRCNSFRCFCTVSVCQYVYYCLHRVAARQSSRRLASMQGARIKACGSFPPQIVLALTLSKITRRCLALRRFAGTPKQNHPKISCSEGRFLSFRSGIFAEIIPAELVAILSCEQARKPLANMYTIACGLSAFAHPKISCSEDRFLSFRSGIPNRNKKQASFRVGIPHKQFEYALYDLGRVYTDDLHKPSSMHSLI